MQLELAFLDLPAVPDEGSTGPWDQIEPQSQIAALVLLSAADCAKSWLQSQSGRGGERVTHSR